MVSTASGISPASSALTVGAPPAIGHMLQLQAGKLFE
jgi:hypothetical protein